MGTRASSDENNHPDVSLPDVSLSDSSLATMPRIARLRAAHFEAPTEVCIERARLMTGWLVQHQNDASAPLSRSRAVAHYLTNREPTFHDDNLLAGGTTSRRIGAPVYPELLGLTIWPELETIGEREGNPQLLTPEDGRILNEEVFPYWLDRSVLEVARRRCKEATGGAPTSLRLFERIVFYICGKAGCISHCVPTYQRALDEGLSAVIDEAAERERALRDGASSAETAEQIVFYQALQTALGGIIEYASSLSKRAAELASAASDPVKKADLQALAEVCAQVPARPARSFREAVNSLWLCQVGIHAENINMAMSPGRLDQVLYPYYRRDVDAGSLTPEQALELCCCLWLKIADNTNLVPETAEKLWGGAGSTPAVTLGGVDADGADAVNDLTYIFLKTTELMALRDPSVNARFNYEVNDRRYRQRLAEVILNTRAIPAIHNDVSDIGTLVNQDVELEHARDFAIVGCVELASSGRDYVSSSSIMFNLAAAMEMTLLNGKRRITGDEQIGPETGDATQFTSFEEFWKAFGTQLVWLLGQAIEFNEILGKVHQDVLPTPLLSAFFEGPMASGRDLVQGGALYNSSGASFLAFPDVCDSLNAVESAVFVDQKLSMAEMIAAIDADFTAPHDRHLPYLKKRAPKFGTEHSIAVKNSSRLVELIYRTCQDHINYRGGPYRPAYWTMTTHAGQGKLAGALPNGRRAQETFSSGITPASQAASSLVEAYNAIGSLPAEHIPGGEAMNMKYTPPVAGEDREAYLERFGDLFEGYFKKGGLQVQFNIQSYETFIDAKKNPHKYPEMIVRVSGYSAYFNDLSAPMKDELITRTQYDLMSGSSVSLPGSWRGE